MLKGGAASDTLDGGTGNADTADWSAATGRVIVTLNGLGNGQLALDAAGVGRDFFGGIERGYPAAAMTC